MNPKVTEDAKPLLACRGCLAACRPLRPLQRALAALYGALVSTNVSEADVLPKYVCSYCHALLLKFADFRHKCQSSQDTFLKLHSGGALVTTELVDELFNGDPFPKLQTTFPQVIGLGPCADNKTVAPVKNEIKTEEVELEESNSFPSVATDPLNLKDTYVYEDTVAPCEVFSQNHTKDTYKQRDLKKINLKAKHCDITEISKGNSLNGFDDITTPKEFQNINQKLETTDTNAPLNLNKDLGSRKVYSRQKKLRNDEMHKIMSYIEKIKAQQNDGLKNNESEVNAQHYRSTNNGNNATTGYNTNKISETNVNESGKHLLDSKKPSVEVYLLKTPNAIKGITKKCKTKMVRLIPKLVKEKELSKRKNQYTTKDINKTIKHNINTIREMKEMLEEQRNRIKIKAICPKTLETVNQGFININNSGGIKEDENICSVKDDITKADDVCNDFDDNDIEKDYTSIDVYEKESKQHLQSTSKANGNKTKEILEEQKKKRNRKLKFNGSGMSEASELKYNMKVIVLSKEEQIRLLRDRKTKQHYKACKYKCEICYSTFSGNELYKRHMAQHEPGGGDLICDVCTLRFSSEDELRTHCDRHRLRMVCNQCGYTCKSWGTARQHWQGHEGVTYDCNVCSLSFTDRKILKFHISKEHGCSHECGVCGEKFLSRRGVNIHMYAAHREAIGAVCGKCGVHFHSESALQRHLAACDHSHRPCAVCGDAFPNEQLLQEHQQEQHENFTCKKCLRSFDSLIACQQHEARHRKNDRPGRTPRATYAAHVCEICGDSRINLAALNIHRWKKHRDFSERPYQCNDCQLKFYCKDILKRHIIRQHLRTRDVRTHHCRFCPKIFNEVANRNKHERRIHAKRMLFKCSVCGVSYALQSSLALHVRNQHEKKLTPYKCDLCQVSYATQPGLSKHLKSKEHLNKWRQKASEQMT